VHAGPPIHLNELHSAQEFLRQNDFPPASDYFSRLGRIQVRLDSRMNDRLFAPTKRDYAGRAAGTWMQVQSAYDHLILSTCYEGNFNFKQGRVKISHRFNQQGRIDFVECKLLRSLQATLNGEIRTLLKVRDYQTIPKQWHAAEAFVLPVLPQELIFLYDDIFRFPKSEVLAWLVNIGHRIVGDLVEDLPVAGVNGDCSPVGQNGDQLPLGCLRADEVAMPILHNAARLESAVELNGDPKHVLVRYVRR
jgi:hypothetical protein